MPHRFIPSLFVASLVLWPGLVAAQEENPADCIQEQREAGAPAADCVNRAQERCLQYPLGTEAGIACYLEAKDRWGSRITERMETIRKTAPEEIAAIAGIEVKYDLKANLNQCDRMEELSLVRQDPDQGTVHVRARCEATAVGLAYVKLVLQSGGIEMQTPPAAE